MRNKEERKQDIHSRGIALFDILLASRKKLCVNVLTVLVSNNVESEDLGSGQNPNEERPDRD